MSLDQNHQQKCRGTREVKDEQTVAGKALLHETKRGPQRTQKKGDECDWTSQRGSDQQQSKKSQWKQRKRDEIDQSERINEGLRTQYSGFRTKSY
jgi:hypothetical protein